MGEIRSHRTGCLAKKKKKKKKQSYKGGEVGKGGGKWDQEGKKAKQLRGTE